MSNDLWLTYLLGFGSEADADQLRLSNSACPSLCKLPRPELSSDGKHLVWITSNNHLVFGLSRQLHRKRVAVAHECDVSIDSEMEVREVVAVAVRDFEHLLQNLADVLVSRRQMGRMSVEDAMVYAYACVLLDIPEHLAPWKASKATLPGLPR